MKNFILLIATGLLINFGYSQEYHKLIQSNKFWDEFSTILPEICYTSGVRHFFTNQDTIINGLTYKVCKAQQIMQVNPGPFCPPFVIDTMASTCAFMREDTVLKKVYINSAATGGMDELIYDFTLNKGDTLHSDYLGNGQPIVIDTVEDLTLNNGETRRTFKIISALFSSYTEGIGGSFGLFAQIPIGGCECNGGIFCIKQNGINLLGSYCDYPYVGIAELKTMEIHVYPNPVKNELNVLIQKQLLGSVFILINSVGKTCLTLTLNSVNNKIPVFEIIPGAYCYRVYSKKSELNGKLIIY
jgi:hypothetical protein